MRYKIIVLSLVLISLISTSKAQESTVKRWYVADAKMACQVGDIVTSCLRIKESLDSQWRDFPYEIAGFAHEKGYEYLIEVSQTPLKYKEDNGPAYTWELIRIISQQSTVFTDKRLLANNTFRLINFEQYGKTSLAVKAKPTIQFRIDTNIISGFAGCNSFSGPCSYATAFMEFGTIHTTLKTCEFQEIEDKLMKCLQGKATFYIRKGMLYIVCENFITLHLKPERSLDSIFKVIEAEKAPKNDINYFKTEDGIYIVNAPTYNDKAILFFNYRPAKLTSEEKKKIKLKLLPIEASVEITEIRILNKQHEKPHMEYAIIVYKNGKKKEVEIRDAN